MKFLDHLLREWLHSLVYHKIKSPKVVGGLYDIINLNSLVCSPNSIGFKNIARLLMGQLAAFYMIVVITEINLSTMIDPSP